MSTEQINKFLKSYSKRYISAKKIGAKNDFLSGECRVVEIKNQTVFPIFRVGSSSLEYAADKVYLNEEIGGCKDVQVLIRDPVDRFVSGINKYCRMHNLDVHETCEMMRQGKIVDKHTTPQLVWLFHLSKFYNGTVTLRPFADIKKITDVHRNRHPVKVNVTPPEEFIQIDKKLINLLGQTIDLKSLVKVL
jgi:hypothetical protein